jgi:Ala-tRNA(Pro) deacylase
MPIPKKVLNFLEKNKIAHKLISHKKVYTAYDTAQTLKKKLGEIAKTLVVKADKNYILAVLPASRSLDFQKLKKTLKVKKVEIAKENVMQKIFKVKPGAMTSFGELYKIPVYVDKLLLKSKKIITSAGTYKDSFEMTAKNFLKATKGIAGEIGRKK